MSLMAVEHTAHCKKALKDEKEKQPVKELPIVISPAASQSRKYRARQSASCAEKLHMDSEVAHVKDAVAAEPVVVTVPGDGDRLEQTDCAALETLVNSQTSDSVSCCKSIA